MMVSFADSQISSYPSPCLSSIRTRRSHGLFMRTTQSNLFLRGLDCSPESMLAANRSAAMFEILADSVIDFRLGQLAAYYMAFAEKYLSPDASDLLELSQDFSDFSSFNSDISGELQRIASLCDGKYSQHACKVTDDKETETLNTELDFPVEAITLMENINIASPGEVGPIMRLCAETLMSFSVPIEEKRGAAEKLCLFAKHQPDFCELIGIFGAIRALIPLLLHP